MHHFFTTPELVAEDRVRLVGEEAHHAARVLRVAPGETISVADGGGRVVDAVVLRAAPDAVEARIILRRTERPAQPVLVLYQAVPKRERMDLVVEKAVELGAREIRPFFAERTIVRWDDRKRQKAHRRWTAVARAAAKQCRSPWLTEVAPPADGLGEVAAEQGVTLVLHEGADDHLRGALPGDPPDRIAVVIGPEGGLTPEEVDELRDAGGRIVTLGERILRTETAGPVALALVAYTYGNLG